MDIHLHDLRTKKQTKKTKRYNVKICVLSSPPFNQCLTCYFFSSGGSSYLKSQTEHPGLLNMKGLDVKTWNYTTIPRQNSLTICAVTRMTAGATPPIPSASKYMFSKTVIGPMLDVEQAPCPHHEVKFTFMKLKSQVGFLCWYGFKRHNCSALLPQHHVLLNSPNQEEWNAWKRHYCTLTWSTVNGWVKVPFEMHDIKNK